MNIDTILIGERHRKDLGDIAALARSIDSIGLLHPVVVRPDGMLIAGERRIAACRMLGWQDIPVTTIDLDDVLRGEHDENTVRKDFTPTEAVAIGRELEVVERAEAQSRQATSNDERVNFTPSQTGKAMDKVADAVGMSRPTYLKAKEVVEAAESEPEKYQAVADKMDRTGNISGAYKELRKQRKRDAKAMIPDDLPEADNRYRLLHGDLRQAWQEIKPASVDAIITDPPYPEEYLPLYEALSEIAAKVLKPGGSLLAMCGQSYLPEIMAMMGKHTRYQWTLAYMTPGGQSAQLWQRKVNTFWKPVLWYVNGDYAGDWIGDVAKSTGNDKSHHHWGQSESGMADLIERFTYPGQVVLDPFCGGGTTGAVAVPMNRRFIGIDNDKQAIETTRRRLAAVNA